MIVVLCFVGQTA